MLEFTVIDTTTNQYPNLWKIATTEEWAKHLMYCDMEGFAISEDGELLLLDECGGVAYCPADRFKVVYTADVAPRAEVFEEVDKFRADLMDKFIDLCRGNDYNKLTLLKIGDVVDEMYDRRIAELKKKYAEG